jgi:hypothetical protein
MSFLLGFAILLIAILAVFAIIWFIFFRQKFTLWELFKKILNLALLPFKLILKLFGIGGGETPAEPAAPTPSEPTTYEMPSIQSTQTEIVRHEIQECPPCNVTCPEPPVARDCKPFEMEIRYLKNMVRFVGAMAKRENAINAQYRELYPGFSVMSPHVRRLSHEYNFLKNQLREDENEWTYFKNYFTKLSGIPSTSSAVHYDLML